MPQLLRTRAEIIHTLCLPEFAIAALSSVDVPRHASLLRLALTNSYFAFCTNYFCTVPYRITAMIPANTAASTAIPIVPMIHF